MSMGGDFVDQSGGQGGRCGPTVSPYAEAPSYHGLLCSRDGLRLRCCLGRYRTWRGARRLQSRVDTVTVSQFHHALDGVSVGTIDQRGCFEAFRDFQVVMPSLEVCGNEPVLFQADPVFAPNHMGARPAHAIACYRMPSRRNCRLNYTLECQTQMDDAGCQGENAKCG